MKFYCIADEDTVRGLRLAGVDGKAVTTEVEAQAALDEASARPDTGIVILTQQVAAGLRPLLDSPRFERDRPLIVEIPGPSGPLPGLRSLHQLVQTAVGISLDLKDRPS